MVDYGFWADAVVLFHFAYFLFTIGGTLLILIGGPARWGFVRRPGFRIPHLLSVLLVSVEALLGMRCPLTLWEYQLRQAAGQSVEEELSFTARIIRRIMFYDFPAWVFLLLYLGFGALVLLLFFVVPLRRRKKG